MDKASPTPNRIHNINCNYYTLQCADYQGVKYIINPSVYNMYSHKWLIPICYINTFVALCVVLVSCSQQIAFSSFTFTEGKKKGLMNALYNFVLKIPTTWGLYVYLLIDVKGQKKFIQPLTRLAVQDDHNTLTYQRAFSIL